MIHMLLPLVIFLLNVPKVPVHGRNDGNDRNDNTHHATKITTSCIGSKFVKKKRRKEMTTIMKQLILQLLFGEDYVTERGKRKCNSQQQSCDNSPKIALIDAPTQETLLRILLTMTLKGRIILVSSSRKRLVAIVICQFVSILTSVAPLPAKETRRLFQKIVLVHFVFQEIMCIKRIYLNRIISVRID
jgi:hypothetical protein